MKNKSTRCIFPIALFHLLNMNYKNSVLLSTTRYFDPPLSSKTHQPPKTTLSRWLASKPSARPYELFYIIILVHPYDIIVHAIFPT